MKNAALILATSLFLSSASALAEPLTICGVEWQPFTKVDGPNIVGGISYEIHKEIFKRLKVDVVFRNVTWNRCVSSVEAGTYAAVTDASERNTLISGPMPISFYPVALYTRSDNKKRNFSYGELTGVTVGAVEGYSLPTEITDKARWKLDFAADEVTAIKKLQAGRYDYYIGDMIATVDLAKKIGADVAQLEPALYSDKLYLTFSPKHKALAENYYKELAKLKSEGFIDKLYLQNLSKTYDQMAQ